jgi:hypothetical protein
MIEDESDASETNNHHHHALQDIYCPTQCSIRAGWDISIEMLLRGGPRALEMWDLFFLSDFISSASIVQ